MSDVVEKRALPQGSFKSRKFFLTIFCILLLTAVCLAAIKFPTLVAILPTFVGGLLGVLSLYFTGNIINKHVTGKQTVDLYSQEASTYGVQAPYNPYEQMTYAYPPAPPAPVFGPYQPPSPYVRPMPQTSTTEDNQGEA